MNTPALSSGKVDAAVDPRFFEALFQNEQNLLKLLVAVRGSSLPAEDKAELRDLILEYSAAAKKADKDNLKSEISQILSAHHQDFWSLVGRRIRPDAADETMKLRVPDSGAPSVARIASIGSPRPRPDFGNTAKPMMKADPKPSEIVQNTNAETHRPATAPAAVSPAPVGAGPVAAPASNQAIQTRINEIKHAVNAKVGNPINLINQNKAIGQEYMAALLDVMKKAGGGSADADSALARLEKAYVAVQELLSKETVPTAPPKPSASAEPSLSISEAVKPAPLASVPAKPSMPPAPSLQPPKSVPRPPVPEAKRSLPNADDKKYEYANQPAKRPPSSHAEAQRFRPSEPTVTASTAAAPASAPVQPFGLGKLADKLLFFKSARDAAGAPVMPSETVGATKPAASKAATADDKSGAAAGPVRSVASVTTLPEKMSLLKQNIAKKEEESKKPLKGLDSAEVSDGLARLLSEWKLFKSSGFLGTGPSGKDHPLYKQLAGLPMAAVIAGRFEGFTPEIKQGITDYMNGWRYEHGILHEMGETFEHYLRRVILVILENQRLKKFEGASGTE